MAQLYFEDVTEGQELPLLEKGPLGPIHLFRWSAAMENWHRIHYDRQFAIEHDKLQDLLINGSLKQQFLVQLVKDWAGRNGWVWKVGFQFRAMNFVGEKLSVWGRVKSTSRTPGSERAAMVRSGRAARCCRTPCARGCRSAPTGCR